MIEKITRKQLYDLIWGKPLTKVQLELGLTYAQIRSICNEQKIPIPGSGFWQMRKNKYGVTQYMMSQKEPTTVKFITGMQ
jgi:uncharacterized protein YebE (UPF0316 family)